MSVSAERRGNATWITITSPETRNALTAQDRRDLAAALYAADADPASVVVVITGAGGHFCSGGDIREFGQVRTTAEASRYPAEIAQPVFIALREMRTPTIARVEGVAAGAGMYLALGCDIVVAESGASFIPTHMELAVPPDWGAIWLLPRIIGLARAKQYLLTGRPIPATTAAGWGLIADAVPHDDLDTTVEGYCRDIARYSPSVVGTTRRGLDRSLDGSLSTFLEWEALAITGALQTPEHQERVRNFLTRRTDPS